MVERKHRKRPGAPRIEDDADRKTVILELRASPREADEIDNRARAAGMSRSAWLRRGGLGHPPRPVRPPLPAEAFDMAEALAIIGRALAHAMRLDPPVVDPALIEELRTRIDAVAAAIFVP